jgi:glycosyltransferase involved in cell wall biosynthesis
VTRPRVVVLRGQQVNPWELRPWEALTDRFEVSTLVPDRHLYELGSLRVERVRARMLSDLVPTKPATAFAARAPFNRYFGLERLLSGAAIVHAAELHFWFTAQAAALKSRLGFRLVTTAWETIPFRAAGRHVLTRPNRRRVLAATDLFLAATERARAALLLEGVSPDRIAVVAPGIDLERFGTPPSPTTHVEPLIVSPGRLVWEKGHQDVLRAVAALRNGIVEAPAAAHDVRVLIVGSGPEESSLRAYAKDLGLEYAVEFRAAVPYDEMPAIYARATAVVLASLPIASWEEQFGMVLAEAMAAGLPIVTTTCGAIPEVVEDEATLVSPGDWPAIAGALADGPLARPGERVAYRTEHVERFSSEAAARRLAVAYDRILAGS